MLKITGETTLSQLEAELARLDVDRVTAYVFKSTGPGIPPRVFAKGLFVDQLEGGNIGPAGTGHTLTEALAELVENADRAQGRSRR